MTTGGAEPVFVDTNILIYASVPETTLHEPALNAIQARTAAGGALWISRQVLREFLATLTRPQLYSGPIPIPTLGMSFVPRTSSAAIHPSELSPLRLHGVASAAST